MTRKTPNQKSAAAMRAHRAFFGPDWREKRARALLEGGRREPIDDRLVHEAEQFLARSRMAAAAAEQAYPAIAQAMRLQDDEALVAVLKIATIGGLTIDEIAARTGQTAEAIEVWQELFFDVRDFLGATDWLAAKVIEAEYDAGRTDVGAKLKLAYVGGPDAVRSILSDESAAPIDDAGRWWRHRAGLFVKAEQALTLVVGNAVAAGKFLRLQAEVMFAERRLELERAKLAEKCREGLRRHEQAMLRLRTAEARAQRRLIAARRKYSAPPETSAATIGAGAEQANPDHPRSDSTPTAAAAAARAKAHDRGAA